MPIRLKHQGGDVRILSPQAFRRKFGVTYASKLRLPNTMPQTFLNACESYGTISQDSLTNRQLADYQKGIARSCVAPTYVALVSDEIGHGLFAYKNIAVDEMIGEYTGLLSRDWIPNTKKAAKFNPYLFKYPFDAPFAIDGQKCGNEMRFINHSFKNANVGRIHILEKKILHVALVAKTSIPKHRQILLDYGKDYWRNCLPPLVIQEGLP